MADIQNAHSRSTEPGEIKIDETQMHHPRLQLNEAIHQPVRLSLLSTLIHAQKVDFAFLREHLELGDSNLSRHLTALEELNYITIEKVFEKKRPRTWISLSSIGRQAFEEYIETLQHIIQYSAPLSEDK